MDSMSVKEENPNMIRSNEIDSSNMTKAINVQPKSVTIVSTSDLSSRSLGGNNGITKILSVSNDNDRIRIIPNKSIRTIQLAGSNTPSSNLINAPKIIRIKSENESPRKVTISNNNTTIVGGNCTNKKVVTISTNPGLPKSTSTTQLSSTATTITTTTAAAAPIATTTNTTTQQPIVVTPQQQLQLQISKKSQAFKISPKTVTITKPDFNSSIQHTVSLTNTVVGSTPSNLAVNSSSNSGSGGYILLTSGLSFNNRSGSTILTRPSDSITGLGSGPTEAKRQYFDKFDILDNCNNNNGPGRPRVVQTSGLKYQDSTTSGSGGTGGGANSYSNNSTNNNSGSGNTTSSWQQYVRQYAHMGPCPVCEDSISGYHYGIFCCESCKGFFKRSVQNHKEYVCHVQQASGGGGGGGGTSSGSNQQNNESCLINKHTRKKCPACRFQKCIEKGMLIEAVRNDRSRGGRSLYPGAKNRVHRFSFDSACDSSSMQRSINLSGSEGNQSFSSGSISFFKTSLPTGSGNLHRALSSRGRTNMMSVLENIVTIEENLSQEEDVLGPIVEDDDFSVYRVLLKLAESRLHRMVRWSRSLPEFAAIETDDQIALVQNCWAELLILDCCFRSLGDPREIHLTSGKCINLEAACELGAKEIVSFILNMTQRLKKLKFDIREFACLKVLLLMQPELKGLKAESRVRMFQETVSQLLLDYTTQNYESDVPNKFYDLIMCLPEIRKAAGEVKQMLATKDLSQFLNSSSLLLELLNCYLPNSNNSNNSNTTVISGGTNNAINSTSDSNQLTIVHAGSFYNGQHHGVTTTPVVMQTNIQQIEHEEQEQEGEEEEEEEEEDEEEQVQNNIVTAAQLAHIEIDNTLSSEPHTTIVSNEPPSQTRIEQTLQSEVHFNPDLYNQKSEQHQEEQQTCLEFIEVIGEVDDGVGGDNDDYKKEPNVSITNENKQYI